MSSLGHVASFKTFTVSHSTWASWPQENVFLVTSTLYLCIVFVVVSVSNCNSWKLNKLLVKMQMACRSVWFWLSDTEVWETPALPIRNIWLSCEIYGKHKKSTLQRQYIMKIDVLSAWHPTLLEAWPSGHWDSGVQSYEPLHGDSADSIGFLWEWGLDKLHSQYPSRCIMMQPRWAWALSSIKMKLGLCCSCRATITGVLMLFR